MTPAQRLQSLYDEFARNDSPVYIVQKRSVWHQIWIDRFLRFITLGKQNRYMTQYVTTLGHCIYVPDDFDTRPQLEQWQILRHELIHVRQFERYGFGLMALIYCMLPLPMGLAYGRTRLEWEAYAETLRAIAESEGFDAASSETLHREIVSRFTGPDYGWMWPFPKTIQQWIENELNQIKRRNM